MKSKTWSGEAGESPKKTEMEGKEVSARQESGSKRLILVANIQLLGCSGGEIWNDDLQKQHVFPLARF